MSDDKADQTPKFYSIDEDGKLLIIDGKKFMLARPDLNLDHVVPREHWDTVKGIRLIEAEINNALSNMAVGISVSANLEVIPAKKATKLYKPTGHALFVTLRFLLDKKTFERVAEQMILDAREEHCEALFQNHLWHARWIHIRLYGMVACALLVKAATYPLDKVTSFFQKD